MTDAIVKKNYINFDLTVILRHCRKFLKPKKKPKEKGYYKLITDEEQRILEEYALRTSQLTPSIGVPF